ncbi:MAG: DUF5131 family protein [Nitrososphaera sp.]
MSSADLDLPLHWRKPRKIFVNPMSDIFHDGIEDSTLDQIFAVMSLASKHTFQLLTKRPERMFDYLTQVGPRSRPLSIWFEAQKLKPPPFPRHWYHAVGIAFGWPLKNVWLGVSVENQETADERIPLLLRTPAALRFASYEPALGPVNFGPFLSGGINLDWAIIGGESGPKARRFDLGWAREAIVQYKAAKIPVFMKQLGSVIGPGKGGDMSLWPLELRIREIPRAHE